MTAEQWNVVLGVLAVVLALACNHLIYRARSALFARDDAETQANRMLSFERQLAAEKEQWLRDSLREQAARHAEELKRVQESHTTALEAAKEAIASAVYGGPKAEARVIPQPPDAEMRGLRKIREETIQAGMKAIKEDYEQLGIPISEEQLRLQAIAFIDGEPERAFTQSGETPAGYGKD